MARRDQEDVFIEKLRQQALSAAGIDPHAESAPALWVGGFQPAGQGSVVAGWQWVNGDGAFTGSTRYTNWLPGEPNDWNSVGVEDDQENSLTIGLRGMFSWNDASGALRGYVVEHEIDREQELVYRSTRYSGNHFIRFNHDKMFSRRVAMTVEAWVHREAGSSTEAVLSHGGIAEGFFFGFAEDKIRFGRSGGFAVLSTGRVPASQWTHVAVSYDGTTARFYIDGTGAGAIPVQHAGSDGSYILRLGATSGGGVSRFRGSLDEVRLWSRARTASEIASARFRELVGTGGESNLELVFPKGNEDEVVWGARVRGLVTRVVGSDFPAIQRIGMLPVDLVVPQAVTPPKFDGNVDPGTECAGAEQMVIRYSDGPSFADARGYLVHDKEYLYVGIEGARLPSGGAPSPDNALEVFLDRAGESTGFDTDLVRGQLFLRDSMSAFAKVGQRFIENPITGDTTVIHVWEAGDPTSLEYGSYHGSERVSELTTARDVVGLMGSNFLNLTESSGPRRLRFECPAGRSRFAPGHRAAPCRLRSTVPRPASRTVG